jgi:RND family efflux transporter MFP subunit
MIASSACGRRVRWPLRILPLVVAAPALGIACAGSSSEVVTLDDTTVAVVHTDTLRRGPLFTGMMVASQVVRVRAEAAGTVTAVLARTGDDVAAGTVLIRLDERVARLQAEAAGAALAQGEASLAQALREAERARALTRIGAMAGRDGESAERAVVAARAQLADARARQAATERQLGQAVVRAPVAGVVSELVLARGEVVAPGAPLLTIVDSRAPELEMWLAPSGAAQLRGRRAVHVSTTLATEAGADTVVHISADVRQVASFVDPQTRQVKVRLALSSAPATVLIGQLLQGRIGLEERPAMVVPEGAIDRRDSVPVVARVHGGVVVRTAVTLGEHTDDRRLVEVVQGLAPGDTVLIGEARYSVAGTPTRRPRIAGAGRSTSTSTR